MGQNTNGGLGMIEAYQMLSDELGCLTVEEIPEPTIYEQALETALHHGRQYDRYHGITHINGVPIDDCIETRDCNSYIGVRDDRGSQKTR